MHRPYERVCRKQAGKSRKPAGTTSLLCFWVVSFDSGFIFVPVVVVVVEGRGQGLGDLFNLIWHRRQWKALARTMTEEAEPEPEPVTGHVIKNCLRSSLTLRVARWEAIQIFRPEKAAWQRPEMAMRCHFPSHYFSSFG